jgi:hypothetical protein
MRAERQEQNMQWVFEDIEYELSAMLAMLQRRYKGGGHELIDNLRDREAWGSNIIEFIEFTEQALRHLCD